MQLTHCIRTVFVLALFAFTSFARADVAITFYSHDLDGEFPHGFFTVKGDLSNGTPIDTGYGFTAKLISPAVLLGSVKGYVSNPPERFIKKSDPHFTLSLDDAGYEKIMAVVTKWDTMPGRSYNLNKRNCVHFVRDALVALGFTINKDSKNYKKPKSFLREVTALNPVLQIAAAEQQVLKTAPLAPPVIESP